jgi:hypothetical protein
MMPGSDKGYGKNEQAPRQTHEITGTSPVMTEMNVFLVMAAPGLDPGVSRSSLAAGTVPWQSWAMGGWVYIMTNRPNGVLYIGITSDLARRAWEHREGVADGFTKRYGLKRLVFAEPHDDIPRGDPA